MKIIKIKRAVVAISMLALVVCSVCGCSSDEADKNHDSETHNVGFFFEDGAATRKDAIELYLKAYNEKDFEIYKKVMPLPLKEDAECCEKIKAEFEEGVKQIKSIECLDSSFMELSGQYDSICSSINSSFTSDLGYEVEDIEPENIYYTKLYLKVTYSDDSTMENERTKYVYNDGGRYYVTNFVGQVEIGG